MWFPSFLTLSSIAASIFWQKNEGKKSMVVMTSMCRDRRFCATHRAEEHIPVVRKRCKHSEGCDGYAYYGCPGSDKRMYCSLHRGEAGVPLKQTCTYLGFVLSDPKPWNPPKPPSPKTSKIGSPLTEVDNFPVRSGEGGLAHLLRIAEAFDRAGAHGRQALLRWDREQQSSVAIIAVRGTSMFGSRAARGARRSVKGFGASVYWRVKSG